MASNYSDIIKKAQTINRKNRQIVRSYSYQKTIGVLSGLGFLIAPEVKSCANSKIDFEEAFQFGLKIEPRILEVLPAAIISFPKSFLHLEKMPESFRLVIESIRKRQLGPDFNEIKFEKFLEAAQRQIKNKRRKAISEKRQPKTFRLSLSSIEKIKNRSSELGIDQTHYLESLINGAN